MARLLALDLVVMVLVLSVGTATAVADDPISGELAGIAKQVQTALTTAGKSTVAVGDFAGPAQIDTNYGPGLALGLSRALQERGVVVDRKAEFSLRGRYAAVPSDRYAGQTMVRLTTELFDRDDEPKGAFQARFYDNPSIARILGVNVKLSPGADSRTRNLEVVEAVERPSATIQGTLVRSSPQSPFAVEVFVAPGPGRPFAARTPALVEGHPFVDIQRGETYQLRIHNGAPFEAAVMVSIDGLNVFQFCEVKTPQGRPAYFFFPISARTSFDVVGWFRTMQRSDSFLVTAYGQGAGSLLRDPPSGKRGVISVGFTACAPAREQLPADEHVEGRGAEGNETGLGPPRGAQFTQVHRVLGVMRDMVSIRYSH